MILNSGEEFIMVLANTDHVRFSRPGLGLVDLEKILQCGRAESKTAKLDQTS